MRNLQKAKPCKISRFEKWETAEKKPQAGLSGKARETPNFGFAIAPAPEQNGRMLKKISQARRKLGGFWPLLLWLPALWAGKAIFLAAAGMLADAQKFFEFDPNAPESSIDGILYRSTAYCVFFIPTFAYALFVRFASPRETRFEKLAFSLPLAAFFAAEGVIALSVAFATADAARAIGWGTGFAAALCAEMAALFGGMWLFRLYANPRNSGFAASLGFLCVGGALASLIAAAYLDGLWAHAYLVFASVAGAAFAADISFRGMAYKILARAFKAE